MAALRLRSQLSDFLTSGASLLILLIGFRLDSREGWIFAGGLLSVISLWAWHANFRRFRLVADLPTARAASAPQGYVELFGRGEFIAGETLSSKLTGLPCLWFRYRIEEEENNQKRLVEEGQSDDTFVLRDSSGSVVIDPAGAEILTTRKEKWHKGNHYYQEWLLLPQDKIYVLGEHITLGGNATQLDLKQDVALLLAEWKRDRADLLKRFDRNGDGEIDLQEWEAAREAAHQEVRQQHNAIYQSGGVEMIRKPADGRLFLIANTAPDALSKRYLRWSWVHLGLFFTALAGTAWEWL